MATNKVYLQDHFYASPHEAARCLLDLPRHIVQVTLIAVASNKAEVMQMLETHYRRLMLSQTLDMQVNDSFITWRELSDQGVLSIKQQGVWMTESRARTLVAMLPGGEAQVVARGELADVRGTPLHVQWEAS